MVDESVNTYTTRQEEEKAAQGKKVEQAYRWVRVQRTENLPWGLEGEFGRSNGHAKHAGAQDGGAGGLVCKGQISARTRAIVVVLGFLRGRRESRGTGGDASASRGSSKWLDPFHPPLPWKLGKLLLLRALGVAPDACLEALLVCRVLGMALDASSELLS